MPAAYVKKLAKEKGLPLSKAEQKWERAKDAAAKQGHSEDYGYITQIFKNMMGVKGCFVTRPLIATLLHRDLENLK